MTTIKYPIADTDHHYWVFETDSMGYEVPELQNGQPEFVLSELVSSVSSTTNPVTDVVIVIHGWNTPQYGNEEIDFYDKFFDAFMKDDINFASQSDRLNPLLIGVHWPSAPGSGRADERIDESTFQDNVARIEKLAKILRETAPPNENRNTQILHQIGAADVDGAPSLPGSPLVANVNNGENLGRNPAGDDIIAESAEEANGQVIRGLFRFGKKILTTVFRRIDDRVFGKFERRSEAVGENGVHILLALLQECAPFTTRFHLICHSLGAAAVCRALVGGKNSNYLLRKKVHSATILQGAIESDSLGEGETYERMTRDLLPVAGPIVVTTSQSDNALKAFKVFRDGPLGLRGAEKVDPMPSNEKVLGAVSADYEFQPGQLFNIEADKFVNEGGFFAGSHGDVFGPEIMRMMRQAIDCQVKNGEYKLDTALSKKYFEERY